MGAGASRPASDAEADECDYFDATFEAVTNLGGQTSIGRDVLKTELRRLTEELGRPPTRDEMNADGAYSATAYRNEFGSWCDNVRSVGHSPVQERRVPDGALLEAIRDLADELGRAPTASKMDDQGAYSQRTCANRFDSWANAVVEAGLEPAGKPKIATSDLLAEIGRLASQLGRPPTVKEMNSDGRYHVVAYYDRFESWREAKQRAGYGEPYGEGNKWKRQGWGGAAGAALVPLNGVNQPGADEHSRQRKVSLRY